MPNAVTAIFGADSTPMSAEFAKNEVVVRRFGKTLSDVNAAENAQMLANSAALKQLIAERAVAKDELARYNSWLERNATSTLAERDAVRAENEELLRKSAILRQLAAESRAMRGVSGDMMMVGSASDVAHVKQMAYLRNKAAIMGTMGSGMAPGFAKLVASEAAGGIAAGAATGFWDKFVKNLQGHGSGGVAQLIHVFRATFDSLVSGMNPSRVLLQQGPQALQALTTMGESVRAALGRVLGFVFSLPGAILAVGAAIAFFTFNHLRRLNDVLDRTAKAAELGFGEMGKTHSDAMREAARSASDLEYQLNRLGISYQDLTEKTQISLAAMREEFQLMREVARLKGASKRSELKAEQEQRKKELELIENNLKEAALQKLQAKREMEDANEAAVSGQEAIDRQAKLKDIPEEISRNDEQLKKYKELQKELQKRMDESPEIAMAQRDVLANKGTRNEEFFKKRLEQVISGMGKTEFKVGEKGKEEMHSLSDVNDRLRLLEAMKMSLPEEQAKLEKTQRDLENAQKEAELRGNKSSQAVEQLTKERDALKASIALHEKYDPQLGRGASNKGGGFGLNANQRIGAYASVPPDWSVLMSNVKAIAQHTGSMANVGQHRFGTGPSPARFGGATHR